MPQSYWAVITALIIVQGSVGGTLAVGVARFVGTLASAVLGGAAALAGEFWRVPQVLLLLLAVAKPELMPRAAVKRIRAIGVTGRIRKICEQSYIIGGVYEARSSCACRIVAIGVTVVGSPSRCHLRRGPKDDPRGESKGRDANREPRLHLNLHGLQVSATIASLAGCLSDRRSSDVHRPSAQSDVEHVAPEQINRSDRQQQERDLPPLRCAQKLRLSEYHNK
jgi:hypothetical protein